MTNMESSAAQVHVKEAALVVPSDPTPTHLLKLSSVDSQLFLRFTIEYLLIYRFNGLHTDHVTARVKSALARALVPYYPLAGRVRVRPDGSCLEVVCRAQGAVFIEATADFTLSDFERAPRYVTEWRRLLALQVADVLKGAPPLVVQLTWLSDGAAALGVGYSHCICDGVGSVEFLNLFAALATGRRHGGGLEFKPKPIWQRHLLDQTPFKQPRPRQHLEFSRVTDHCQFMTRFTPDQLTPTAVTFDEWRLNELKNSITPTSQLSKSSLTSFEVLSAKVWRSWAKALNFPPQQILKLLFSIDIRHRVKPSLPTGYYGNAIVLGCAQATARDLTEKGLAYATELIKEAKNRVDDQYVKEVVNSVSLNGARGVPDPVGVLILSQWSKLGLERVDFGIGRPVQVGPVCTDKYCILLPVDDHSRSVKVMLAVPSVAVDKYVDLMRAVQ
ncbi:omega-hydroxypalmitate O-feruloyl transferase-like [Cynara cardunculus var. scolymus]|uniref:Chloramphenicol acetyltransferase-like domain-containing protein n=1 Tax=Cynara cardunculus var. scolymus TaxID=59895 RepID=A0A103YIX4_CYNCS|nr:omega-hydroxypalmitate O-feruloyl transferase-like [Cynara cardunculus var. scolymus]KVI09927.1 Chloramphenicol acetyltransferase-like domain-containing protein [Cynara cardunculus var. scolymus]